MLFTVTFGLPALDCVLLSNAGMIGFAGCTNVYINEKFQLAEDGVINSGGNYVTMYVNDDVQIERGSDVRARIHAGDNAMLVKVLMVIVLT